MSRLRTPLFLAAVGAAAWILVGPWGDFPLNDDWAYAGPVRRLAEEGVLRLSDWASPPDLPPIFLGALASAVFGFSHVLLRLCTMVWSLAGVFFLYKTLEDAQIGSEGRWLACGLLFFNPLYFILTFSFHTDVPFLALLLGAVFCFGRAGRGPRWEWAGSAFLAAAVLTRQTGAAAVIGALCLSPRPIGLRRIFRTAALPVAALGIFYAWFLGVHGPTWASVNYMGLDTWARIHRPLELLWSSVVRAAGSLLYAALFCAPYALHRPPSAAGASARRRAALGLVGLLLVLFLGRQGLLPYFDNVFHRKGLGTLTGYLSEEWKPAFLWSAPAFWAGLTLAAAAALWAFVARKDRLAPAEKPAMALLAPAALATLAGAKFFDRYTLVWTAGLLLSLAVSRGGQRPSRGAWAGLAFWAVLSLAGARDYFAWNRAKWDLGREAVSLGFAPGEVANGLDWAAHWTYESEMARLKAAKPLDRIGEFEWKRADLLRAAVSFSPTLFPPERVRGRRAYRSPLAPRGGALYLYQTE